MAVAVERTAESVCTAMTIIPELDRAVTATPNSTIATIVLTIPNPRSESNLAFDTLLTSTCRRGSPRCERHRSP